MSPRIYGIREQRHQAIYDTIKVRWYRRWLWPLARTVPPLGFVIARGARRLDRWLDRREAEREERRSEAP